MLRDLSADYYYSQCLLAVRFDAVPVPRSTSSISCCPAIIRQTSYYFSNDVALFSFFVRGNKNDSLDMRMQEDGLL